MPYRRNTVQPWLRHRMILLTCLSASFFPVSSGSSHQLVLAFPLPLPKKRSSAQGLALRLRSDLVEGMSSLVDRAKYLEFNATTSSRKSLIEKCAQVAYAVKCRDDLKEVSGKMAYVCGDRMAIYGNNQELTRAYQLISVLELAFLNRRYIFLKPWVESPFFKTVAATKDIIDSAEKEDNVFNSAHYVNKIPE